MKSIYAPCLIRILIFVLPVAIMLESLRSRGASGPTLLGSSLSPEEAGSFRERIAGHYVKGEPEEPFHFLDNRIHSPLLDLRIYPSRPGVPGHDSYTNGCDKCGRPHRIFNAKFVRWIFDFETDGICSICCWKKVNFPVLRLSLYRLWPTSCK